MKDPCIKREQSIGIHDIVNDQGFAMQLIGQFQTRSAIWKFSVRESIQQSKRMD